MKRTPIERHTPLVARTGLTRTTELSAGPGLARNAPPSRSLPLQRAGDPAEHTNGAQRPARAPRTSRAAGVPTTRRRRVYARDGDRCGRCGRDVWAGIRSIQHRDPRGVGGGGPDRHAMSNLVTVCGLLSTDPQFCHYAIETWRTAAQASGFLVPSGIDPREWPIHLYDGWFLLDDHGARVPTDPPRSTP